jgi:hypothetical protein
MERGSSPTAGHFGSLPKVSAPVWTVFADNGQPVLSIHSHEKAVELPNELQLSRDRLILPVTFAWHTMQPASEDAASVVAQSRRHEA